MSHSNIPFFRVSLPMQNDGLFPILFFSVQEITNPPSSAHFVKNRPPAKDSSLCATNNTRSYFAESNAARYVFPIPVAAYTSPFAAPSMRLSCNAYNASICAPRGRYIIRTFSAFLSSFSSAASYFARSLDTAGFFHALEYRFNSSSSIMIEWFRNRSSNVA